MPQIDTITPACWLDYLPQIPEDRFALLTDVGFIDQSALYFPSRYTPVTQRFVLTGASVTDLDNKVNSLRGLRRKKVRVDDGLHPQNKCLVLAVLVSLPSPCVMIIGGSSPGDTWEQEVAVIVLPTSPDLA